MYKNGHKGVRFVVDSKIKAVHDDDLSDLLISLDVYEDIVNKKHRCLFCDVKINFSNLAGIFPHNNEIGFCCNSIDCRLNLMGFGAGKERADAVV